MKIEIKARFTGAVLFAHEAEGNTLRLTVEKAVSVKANLRSADLHAANLSYADLRYANLHSANLRYANLHSANLRSADLRSADLRAADLRYADLHSANLRSADLRYADLHSANLRSADLRSADLSYANLHSANLDGSKLIGERPFLQIGPIGSRADYLLAFITDSGVKIQTGCFFGTQDKFRSQVVEVHGTNQHAQEYLAALKMIDVHALLWSPKTEDAKAAA